ncbi:MAG: response regulator transcription factor [Micrococcaceae bacterium]
MIKVLIADDHPIIRMGIRALLEDAENIEIMTDVASAEEAIDYCKTHELDIVLLDLQFGEDTLNGAKATKEIVSLNKDISVLILTNYDSDSEILAAVEAGAQGYLLKDTESEELIAAIEATARGESALSPFVMNAVVRSMQQQPAKLSKRETEVTKCVAEGLTNKEIAERLYVSEATVKSHLVNIFDKFDVQSRTQVIVKMQELGLL